MPSSIGVNLRVTGHCSQGGRKYMEDMFSVAYQQTEDERDLEYAFFGIYDGHGGQEAATFAKEHLLDNIVNQKGFWSDRDSEVLRAIREGFLHTHLAMWRQLEHWPKTAVGFPSTSGTTASVAFIRRGKIYIGHVGDSSIVLGYQDDDGPWKGIPLTREHKPENKEETQRIEEAGGKVVKRSGVPRVVWNRPRLGHKGPVRRSTRIDEIPFLAVARSLGDLWSYNPALDVFVVSPDPDVIVHTIDVSRHRCLIFGTDGLWNVMSPNAAVSVVQAAEAHNDQHLLLQGSGTCDPAHAWVNPSKSLVDRALEEWRALQLHADNTSVVTLMLDPPGPPRVQVLLNQRQQQQQQHIHSCITTSVHQTVSSRCFLPGSVAGSPLDMSPELSSPEPLSPAGGVAIYTRSCEVPDSSCELNPSEPPALSPSLPPRPAAVQSSEVSSSGCVSPNSYARDKSIVGPKSGGTSSKNGAMTSKTIAGPISKPQPGIKRRHSSSSASPPMERRKRTRSEHDCLSKSDEDLSASDAENERVAWPVWNGSRKSSTNKTLHTTPENKLPVSSSRSGKAILPLCPTTPANTNMSCDRILRSESSVLLPKKTLRSRNASAETHPKASSASHKVLVSRSSRIHRPPLRRTSWPRTTQRAILTRSRGRSVAPRVK